ncbi:MAG TPA: histidine phosphatase family protein [Ktedonobacteraceae bacterium]|jgi:probable phosphoglycerate mutase
MQKPLKRLIREGHDLLQLIGIYCTVTCRFWRWRLYLWFQQFRRVESSQTLMKQTLLIIRHGQTVWNVEHRLPGQLPGVALNENGRQQAARLAEALSVLPISAIISSPLERAYVTATYVGQKREVGIQLEPDLMDTNVGPWAGEVIQELAKKDPAWSAYVRDPTVAPEGVETFPQVQQRVVAAVERWRTQDGIGPYPAFVAHADVVKLLVAHYTGLDARKAGSLIIDNASVSLVELEDEQPPRVLSIGWSPHPGWLKSPSIPEILKKDKPEEVVGEQKT